MAAIFQTFLNAFSWMKMHKCRLRFHWCVPNCPINTIGALVEITAWRRPGDKPLSQPMMVSLLMHICVIQPQWVKFLCDAVSLPSRNTASHMAEWRHLHKNSRREWSVNLHIYYRPLPELLMGSVHKRLIMQVANVMQYMIQWNLSRMTS